MSLWFLLPVLLWLIFESDASVGQPEVVYCDEVLAPSHGQKRSLENGESGSGMQSPTTKSAESGSGMQSPTTKSAESGSGMQSPTTKSAVGTTLRFDCIDGYHLSGVPSIVCLENGTWSNAPPSCDAVHCPLLPRPMNGAKSTNRTSIGTELRFHCYEGYILNGTSNVTCLSNGSWSGPEPFCQGVHCGPLEMPPNGTMSTDETIWGTRVQFACDNGNVLVGMEYLTCLFNGSWSSSEPLCNAVYCNPLSTPTNGAKSTGNVMFETEVKFACNEGYTLIGSPSITCLSNGSWSSNPSVCEAVTCDPVPSPLNGKKLTDSDEEMGSGNADGRPYGTTYYFDCDEGYKLLGVQSIFCSSNGAWSGSAPLCQVDLCLSMPCQNNGTCLSENGTLTCLCSAYFVGEYCEIEAGNLYPFGLNQGDKKVPNFDDVTSPAISLPQTFPFGILKHKTAFISSNGLVSFDVSFNNYQSHLFPGRLPTSVVAPFWSDIHVAYDDGNIFYHVYNHSSSPILQRASDELTAYSGVFFQPTMVLVATWDRVPQYPYGVNNLRNTFQVVLSTDGLSSYALFNYPNNGLEWVDNGVIGYASKDFRSIYNHPLSLTHSLIYVARNAKLSNVGVAGRFLACLMATDGNSAQNCANDTFCNPLTAPVNGAMNNTNTALGTLVRFRCHDGYHLSGREFVMCYSTGNWSGTEPSCEAFGCRKLQNLRNGLISTNDTSITATVNFSCNSGFVLNGVRSITCQSNGTWSSHEPSCQPYCRPLDVPHNGTISTNETSVGTLAQFDCQTDYYLVGFSNLTCKSNGEWSGNEPVCRHQTEGLSCSSLDAPGNGSLNSNATSFLSRVTFACDAGYTLYPFDDETLQCVVDTSSSRSAVKWDRDDPKCGVIPQVQLLVRSGNSTDYSGNFVTLLSQAYSSLALVVVDCQLVKGYPTTEIQWKIEKTLTVVSTNTTDDVYQQSVSPQMRRIVFQSFGASNHNRFMCEARNPPGSDSATLKILLQSVPDAPSQPKALTMSPYDIEVTWTAPSFNGHSSITTYELQYRKEGDSTYHDVPFSPLGPTTTSFSVTRLTSDTKYEFQVRARNEIGYSNYSASSEAVRTMRLFCNKQ
ncbi:sushi, von Willebrand factor type A, EGF and pentraxin domain-containing protein 1-like isoform X2 [Oscarella lobularis]|uniref:sushi, von Willebrand factor type A, EGF and pentraxin domain-containing protein 1-like isoform X2 n=1 Tax=Oscarella lobularis TaxID=121494 RepID=UPI003313FF61